MEMLIYNYVIIIMVSARVVKSCNPVIHHEFNTRYTRTKQNWETSYQTNFLWRAKTHLGMRLRLE